MNFYSNNRRHEWLVRMKVDSSVNIGTKVLLGDVEFIQRKKWMEAAARVIAASRDAAEKVAVRKVSDLLNILSFVSNSSTKLAGVEPLEKSDSAFPTTTRIINTEELDKWRAIEAVNDLELFRALGYYRKGLNEPDPFDAFVGFWNAVEIICSNSSGRGIANKILNSARTHAIEITQGEVDDLTGTRNRIVHGAKQYHIDQIELVAKKIPKIQDLARRFLNVKIRRATTYSNAR